MGNDNAVKSVRETRPKSVIQLNPLEIIGKVQRPHVFYVIERGDLKNQYDMLIDGRNTQKDLDKSVQKAPF